MIHQKTEVLPRNEHHVRHGNRPHRRIAVVQLEGTPNVPGLLNYTAPPDPVPIPPPAAPPDWQKVLPWIAAASGVLTLFTVLERFRK